MSDKKRIKNSIKGHDAYFRGMMKHPKIAKDFLAARLPKDIVAAINLDCLTLEPTSFIEEDAKEYLADLLFNRTYAKMAFCKK